ncbi:MAG TPA: DUF1501 domain-containing protein [Thermoanaerobaculia bacterium]|jgi:hypothetical protein|nr:DUF1501 domain-containing protein [Thermoanaerobaculia bacterium]
MKLAGTSVVASFFADVASARLLADATSVNPTLLNSARNCILIFLSGAPSQIDTFDLKEGSWTPTDFAPATYGAIRFPQGLMPKTADQIDNLAIIRCGLSWAAVHQLAQSWVQIARNPAGATGRIAPHIGAVVSLESQKTRTAAEILPGFISLGAKPMVNAGYLPAWCAPFAVQPASAGLPLLAHPGGAARLNDRWTLLHTIDRDRTGGGLGKNASDMDAFYGQAKQLIDSPEVNQIFSFTGDEHARYGATPFGDSCVVARKLVSAHRGARFVQITFDGWDHHSNIYGKTGNSLYTQMHQFDPGFGALLADLSIMPGVDAGKSMLDETLIVVLGEFGRTVGELTGAGGRDHLTRMSIALAGGGVRGGTVIGRTDVTGAVATEYDWSANRDVRPEDLTSTIYSALGIDYTTVRYDDPLGRGFEYVPFAKDGVYQPVGELF